jgi:thioredoxin-like negative regulator of GroEL
MPPRIISIVIIQAFALTVSLWINHAGCYSPHFAIRITAEATARWSRLRHLQSISDIGSTYEMVEFTQSSQEDLAVVCFHANWCKACQKFQVLYRKLDASNPRGVRFANVEYSKNTALSKSFGVAKLPTLQFYRGGTRLESFSCGPKSFSRVLGTVQFLMDEIEKQKLDEQAALPHSELGGRLSEAPLGSSSPSIHSPSISSTTEEFSA